MFHQSPNGLQMFGGLVWFHAATLPAKVKNGKRKRVARAMENSNVKVQNPRKIQAAKSTASQTPRFMPMSFQLTKANQPQFAIPGIPRTARLTASWQTRRQRPPRWA
jgi:hypothetical protein